MGDTAYRADYIGNALWGAIMGSHGWPELVSKAGAGAYQLLRAAGGNVRPGPFWSFYDDPRDTEAMLVSKSRAVPEPEGCGWSTKTTWKVIPRCLYRREASQAVTTLEIPTLDTPRLRLRAFTESDFPAYRILVADPQVMRFLGDGRPLSDIDAWRQLATIVGHWALRGFGLWGRRGARHENSGLKAARRAYHVSGEDQKGLAAARESVGRTPSTGEWQMKGGARTRKGERRMEHEGTGIVVRRLASVRRELRERFAVVRIGVFGSWARGEEAPDSDVDILVELADPTFDRYMDLKFRLEELLERPVDLVLADTVKPRIKPIIEREVVYA